MPGRLEVKVDGDSSGFKHTMESVKSQAKGAMDSISHSWTIGVLDAFAGGIAGALSFEGVKSAFEGFMSRAAGLRDISEQLEMATDQTQKWQKATDRLGLSFGGMEQVLMSIASKRQEALRDPKAADLFSVLGISRDEVLHSNASDFAKRVLQAGGSGAQNREILEMMIGRRGLKYASAANIVDQMQPSVSADTIEEAHKLEMAKKAAGDMADAVMGEAVELATSKRERRGLFALTTAFVTPAGIKGTFDAFFGRRTPERAMLKALFNAAEGPEEKTQNALTEKPTMQTPQEAIKILDDYANSQRQVGALIHMIQSGASESSLNSFIKGGKLNVSKDQLSYLTDLGLPKSSQDLLSPESDDPLEGIKRQQENEFKLRQQESEFGLHEAQRRNMTIAERKKSIAADLDTTNKEIEARKKAQQAGLIYGMTKDQQSNLLPTDAKKQLQDDAIALLGLETRSAGFTNELRQNRSFSFDADSMARVGLYSAQTLSINPMLALGEKQLQAIQSVERAVRDTARSGPHQR